MFMTSGISLGFYIVREFQYISVSYSFIVYGDEIMAIFLGFYGFASHIFKMIVDGEYIGLL